MNLKEDPETVSPTSDAAPLSTPQEPWWRTATAEAFRTQIGAMSRSERRALHEQMRTALDADAVAIAKAVSARGPLAEGRRRLATLGALTSATIYDAQGKPLGVKGQQESTR